MSQPSTPPTDLPEQTAAHKAYQKKSYRYYALAVLTLIYVFNFVDRQIIVILSEYIIEDLDLTLTQYGMLSGIAFAAIYCVFGIPIARIADKGKRRNVIAVSVTVWSLFTALCGSAQNFWQLFAARFGVGIGEAGGSPPAHSMVSDIFPVSERATALSIYSLGVYGGILVGYVGGAYLVQWFDWRVAFVVVGLPGVLLAILLRLTVLEPPRGFSEARSDTEETSFKEVLALLWSRKAFRHLSFACALHAFVTYGVGNFMVIFLSRVHDMPTIDIGKYYGLVAGIGGLAGTLAGGWLSDTMANKTNNKNWYIWIPFISTLAAIPFALITFLVMDNGMSATLSWLIPVFFGGFYLAPCIAMTHGMVGLRMRALSSAVLFFVLNLIGLGLGPILTGWAADMLEPKYATDAIRYALSLTIMVNVWCAFHYYLCTRTLKHSLDNAPA
ncbi:major facilitator superfamily transporter [marine gamma proteobacterium HTCC2143]|jgi:MFS family permease|uniref:Major facilitator superfamily transporter n=1 Tax=marine gamma proteobacterium HTCC2143 TaxID=247633 RepID=A0Y8Q1_9GAMM|nr:major facilitator superfamily transporter [marine gamma proteobacterium HTCC2143]